MTIRNVKFYNNNTGLIFKGVGNLIYNNLSYGNYYYGMDPFSSGSSFVYNNTIVANGSYGIHVQTSGSSTIRNNIIWGNGGTIWVEQGTVTQSNNLTSDPLFVNLSAKDLHLQNSSPAIKAGLNLSSVFKSDYEGKKRPSSGAWDIGAYETGNSQAIEAPNDLKILKVQ